MTTANHTLLARTKVFAALGVTSLALIAASPANAIYRSAEPTSDEPPVTERTASADDSPKQGCSMNLQRPDGTPGQTVVYPHGYSFSVTNTQTGKTHTYTCNNGTWVETISSTAGSGDYIYEVDGAYVNDQMRLVLVNAHHEYSYSTSGGYYAAP